MAVVNTPIFPQTIFVETKQIVNSDSTNLVTLLTGDADGTRIDSIIVSSTDTTARDLQLWITKSATDYLLGTVQIAINSGNVNSTPSVQYLTASNFPVLPVDANGNRFLMLDSGVTIKAKVLVAVTSAKAIALTISGGHF
jgi:hypothetical protein